MPTYLDFVTAMVEEPALFDELTRAMPFADADAVDSWFTSHGYDVSEADCETLLAQQNLTLDPDEDFQY